MLHQNYQAAVSLRLLGNNLDFPAITHRLGMAPSRTLTRGTRTAAGREQTMDMWLLDGVPLEDATLDASIRKLTEMLPEWMRTNDLHDNHGIETIDLFCAITARTDSCKLRISTDSLRLLSDVRCDIEISWVLEASANGFDQECTVAQENIPEVAREVAVGIKMIIPPDSLKLNGDSGQSNSDLLSVLSRSGLWLDVLAYTKPSQAISPDAQIMELNEILKVNKVDLNRIKRNTFTRIECHCEIGNEWDGTTISYKSFELPIALQCPLLLDVGLSYR